MTKRHQIHAIGEIGKRPLAIESQLMEKGQSDSAADLQAARQHVLLGQKERRDAERAATDLTCQLRARDANGR